MDIETYLRRLSDLGREFGIGLTGEIQSYEMEREDFLFDYSSDAEGSIALGSPGDANADAGAGAGRDA